VRSHVLSAALSQPRETIEPLTLIARIDGARYLLALHIYKLIPYSFTEYLSLKAHLSFLRHHKTLKRVPALQAKAHFIVLLIQAVTPFLGCLLFVSLSLQ
jgi:hypothetical protein